jgi:hypothetical protein
MINIFFTQPGTFDLGKINIILRCCFWSLNSSDDEIYNADHTGVHAHKWRCFKKGLEKKTDEMDFIHVAIGLLYFHPLLIFSQWSELLRKWIYTFIFHRINK